MAVIGQEEFHDAEKIFDSAMAFVDRRDEGFYDADWNPDEVAVSQQIAMYNVAYLREKIVQRNGKGNRSMISPQDVLIVTSA